MNLLILKEGKIPVKKDNFSFVRTNTIIVIFDKLGREEVVPPPGCVLKVSLCKTKSQEICYYRSSIEGVREE